MKTPIKHISEYALLRLTALVVNLLPYRVALLLSWFMAAVAFYVFRFRVTAAASRIREVFGDEIGQRRIRRIAWLSWRNTVFTLIETLRFPRMTKQFTNSVMDYGDLMEKLDTARKDGTGAIIATAHMGSWEMAGVLCRLHDIPVFYIVAPQRNLLVSRYFNRLRSAPGITVITRGGNAMKEVIKRLRAGGVLAILPDVRVRTKGLQVPFLGGEANVGTGTGLFARHMNVPIVPCIITRAGWTRHRIRVHDLIYPGKEPDRYQDIRRMTEQTLGIIEKAIRLEPEQWFWFNSRWILDPVKKEGDRRAGADPLS
ncbi:MAG: lysophospholipid acyltransferase family protein [Kiritimatiellia bacterium]